MTVWSLITLINLERCNVRISENFYGINSRAFWPMSRRNLKSWHFWLHWCVRRKTKPTHETDGKLNFPDGVWTFISWTAYNKAPGRCDRYRPGASLWQLELGKLFILLYVPPVSQMNRKSRTELSKTEYWINSAKLRLFSIFSCLPYYNTFLHPSYNARSFHIFPLLVNGRITMLVFVSHGELYVPRHRWFSAAAGV